MLPHLITFRHPGQAQAVRQDLLDKWLVRQPVGEAHHHRGVFLGEAKQAGLLTAHGRRQRQAGQDRQIRIRFAIGQQHQDVHAVARPEVIAQPGRRRRIRNCDHTAEAWQVIAAVSSGNCRSTLRRIASSI